MPSAPEVHEATDGTRQRVLSCGCVALTCEHGIIHIGTARCRAVLSLNPWQHVGGTCDGCCDEYELRDA